MSFRIIERRYCYHLLHFFFKFNTQHFENMFLPILYQRWHLASREIVK